MKINSMQNVVSRCLQAHGQIEQILLAGFSNDRFTAFVNVREDDDAVARMVLRWCERLGYISVTNADLNASGPSPRNGGGIQYNYVLTKDGARLAFEITSGLAFEQRNRGVFDATEQSVDKDDIH